MATRKRSTKPKAHQQDTQPKREPVSPENIQLERGKGGKGRGGDPGGAYWHIYVSEKRAGYVFINIIDEPPFGEHASIQINVNAQQRGRRIGRVAYRLACEQSGHDKVLAHMRKSNTASRRAAEASGFEVVENVSIPQLTMVWRRKSNDESTATT